jgi:type I restriction-modification system DNA methylase subunit
VVALGIRAEIDVQGKIRDVLKKFVDQKFNGVTITEIKEQYEIDGRWADLAVLKDDGRPILLIETKKKYERGGYRAERLFIPTSEHVMGQVVAYAALLKKRGVYVPFVATANDTQLALFVVPEKIEELVNWRAIDEREYGEVIKKFYDFRDQFLLFHKRHSNFSEEFFKELLDTITGIYAEKYGLEEKRQEPHWSLIEDFRGFVELLALYVQGAIAPNDKFREDITKAVEEHAERTGYRPPPEALAREMAYVLMNKIIFYKVLERYYKLPELKPAHREGLANTCSSYLKGLMRLFEEAVKASKDFETIFRTGVYDLIDFVESEEVLRALDWLIGLLDYYQVEKLGDLIGFIYEELIPGEERHNLGQFYTPKPIAELIVKWCMKSPDDKVLDPGCGSGTFLVEAYKRLVELKLKKPFKDVRHVPEEVHEQILRQLYGIDINEFPAHLTAMNLAMRNPRTPSTIMNVFVRDYFTILPAQSLLAPYTIRTPEGERQVEVVFKDFDCVVGNPPYTRWTQISEVTQDLILERLKTPISKYGLTPQVSRGLEPGIYVYWIIHSTGFLREGGRLGMIISDSWLQTDYGLGFLGFLLDNYKVHAVIDVSVRVFPVPLIGTCVVLLERSASGSERDSNKAVFAYLDVRKESVNIEEILKFVGEVKGTAQEGQLVVKELAPGARMMARAYSQGWLAKYEGKAVNLIFGAEDLLSYVRQSPLIKVLSEYFEPARGNTTWSVWAIRGGRRPDVGGNEFFYLTEGEAEEQGIPEDFLHPLLPSSRYLKFFTFTQKDWEGLRKEGVECYLFLCHRPGDELPESVRRYIQLGEGPNAQVRLRRRPGEAEGRPVSESQAAQVRRRHRDAFFGWYDLGGVVEAPIIASRYARYWHRFALATYNVACDDDVMAFIPLKSINLSLEELKALLAYLNSSIMKLYLEVSGRTAGGVGPLALEANVLRDAPILDVKRLPKENLERLAGLFDKLEAEARRLGGADEAENVFGSELARELTGKEVRIGVPGLFNTIIKEVDYEVARVLGLEHLVEGVRATVLEMARRRLSRAQEAKREAIKGSEELPKIKKPRRKKAKETKSDDIIRRLDEFFKS